MFKPCAVHIKSFMVLYCLAGAFLLTIGTWERVLSADPSPAPSIPPADAPATVDSPSVPEEPKTPKEGQMKKGAHRMREACEADIKAFCSDVKRGEGRILQCLEGHAKEISPTCAGMLEKRAERKQAKPR